MPWQRIGVGLLDRPDPALALFVPSDLPVVTVSPPDRGDHVALAVHWALDVLGHGFRGGRLVLVTEPSTRDWSRCLAAVLAVDDAAGGGHRPAGAGGAELLDRIFGDPHELAAAVHL